MPDYKQSNLNGTSWIRANSVSIQNPLDYTPSITYHEYEAMRISDKTMQNAVSSVGQEMNAGNENITFPLINSEDWSQPMVQEYKDAMIAAISSGNVPIWVIYQLLNSHYAFLAKNRDIAAVEAAANAAQG
jgi:hypothetical protein